MAQRPKGYGMTAELNKKKAARHDDELERQAIEFITSNTGKEFPGDFHQSLKDGILLCHLANALKPGSITKINEGKMPFKMMENIGNFLAVCEDLGVNKLDLFQTVDLYEAENLPQVTAGILALKRKINKEESTPNIRNFTEEQKKAGNYIIGLQMGTNKCASQKGMTAPGAMRQIRHEDNMDRS